MNTSNVKFHNNTTELEDAFLSSLTDAQIYQFIQVVCRRYKVKTSVQAKYGILEDQYDELENEALYRAFAELKEKGISDDMAYCGRNKKIEKKGKYVLLGDIYGYYKVALINVCRDHKKYMMADKRGGGKVSVTSLTNTVSGKNKDSEYEVIAESSMMSDHANLQEEVETKELEQKLFETIYNNNESDQFIDFARMKVVLEAKKSEIVKEMGLSYSQYKKLSNKLEEVGMQILA